jgi:hypothetical protein
MPQVYGSSSSTKKPGRAKKRAAERALQSPASPKGVAARSRATISSKGSARALRSANAGPSKKTKGPLKETLARTTGTTTGEAAGILKNTRRLVRAGATRQAQRKLSSALAGGPRAGIKKTGRTAVAASARSQKVVGKMKKKIGSRRGVAPGRKAY